MVQETKLTMTDIEDKLLGENSLEHRKVVEDDLHKALSFVNAQLKSGVSPKSYEDYVVVKKGLESALTVVDKYIAANTS